MNILRREAIAFSCLFLRGVNADSRSAMNFYEELEEDDVDTVTFTEYSRRILKGGRAGGGGRSSYYSSGGSSCEGDDCPAWWIPVSIIAGLILIAFIGIRVIVCINRCK